MRLIPDNQVAVADGSVCGAAVMALVMGTTQPIDRQIIQDLTGGGLTELTPALCCSTVKSA
ncbi:hypothetical protein B738_11183 [Photorhabdus temperata subsp. temperata M1021]|nr:hypothetical protein B738_11183 [Photorhabdus temperata subsp. temperata M1021]